MKQALRRSSGNFCGSNRSHRVRWRVFEELWVKLGLVASFQPERQEGWAGTKTPPRAAAHHTVASKKAVAWSVSGMVGCTAERRPPCAESALWGEDRYSRSPRRPVVPFNIQPVACRPRCRNKSCHVF